MLILLKHRVSVESGRNLRDLVVGKHAEYIMIWKAEAK